MVIRIAGADNFLSRLFGGERKTMFDGIPQPFLSRLFGGERRADSLDVFLSFLSRLFGGEPGWIQTALSL